MKKWLSKIFGILLVLYCVGVIIDISKHKNIYQWDFLSCYYSTKAYEAGLNPYDANTVSEISGKKSFAYDYPPITLYFFKIFTKLDYNSAFDAYLILKCVLLAGLILLWRNVFLNKQTDFIFYLLCLLAFDTTIYIDLRAGNPCTIEQFMIWLALFFYLKRKYTFFCIAAIAAAIFKIQPIFFLFLLLFIEDKNKYKYLIGSFCAFGAIFLATYLFEPNLFSNFITVAVGTTEENGIFNPSTFSFAQDLLQTLSKITGIVILNKAYLILYLIIVTPVLLASRLAYISIKNLKIKDEEKWKWIIFLMCFVYALICPRFMNYSYIIIIVPAYFVIKRASCIKPNTLLSIFTTMFIVYLTFPIFVSIPGSKTVAYFFWNYYPLTAAYCLWGLFLCEISSHHKAIQTPAS